MSENAIKLFADSRESRSQIVSYLQGLDSFEVEVADLYTADYVLEGGIAIERKAATDFVLSIFDKRLFGQLALAKEIYKRVVYVVEGDIYSTRSQIHPDALDGAISYLTTIEGASIVPTKNASHTGKMISTMARHASQGLGYDVALRASTPKGSLVQSQFVVEGLPGVGPTTARTLLNHFGSAINVFNASAEELMSVKGFGKKKVDAIREALDFNIG